MELYDLGKEPISAEQPAGGDVSYDEDFDELSREIKKLSSPTAESVIDWSRVSELCRKILAEESKNLQVACYLSVALCHTDGLQGCVTGIHILRDLLENFWDTMYPPKKRKKGRINSLAWWNEKLRNLLDDMESETWDGVRREEAVNDLRFLDSFIGENLPDGPILRPLIEVLSGLILEAQAPEAEVDPAPDKQTPDVQGGVSSTSVPEKTVPVAAVPASTNAAGDGTEDADEFFSSGQDFLTQASTRFFEQDYTRPVSYQLNRLIAWSQVDSPPPADHGKTMLPPPDEQVVTLLTSQYEAGQWSALLSSAEGHVRQYLFWLDLHFWVSTALEKQHAGAAAQSVAQATLLYVQRLNTLERLSFADGTPFAGEETREWLRTLSGVATDEPGAGSIDTAGDAVQCQTAALQILADKGLPEALHYFQEKSRTPRSGREQFVHDLACCQLILKGKEADLAAPFARRMLEQIKITGLEEWDPNLALAGMAAAYKTFKQAGQDDLDSQSMALRDRMILLAPEKAVNFI